MITPRNLAESAKTQIVNYQVADLAAAASIADIPIFRCPKDITIVEVGILPEAAFAGVDNLNTCAIAAKVGATTIASKIYNATVTPPAKGVYDSLGAISNADRLDGDVVTVSVTNGTTANPPAMTLQIKYIINEVV